MLKSVLRNVGFATLVAAAGVLPMSAASSTTPDRSWLGVKRLVVLAQVRPDLSDPDFADRFCGQVKKVAERGAPFPVDCVEMGDPALQVGGAALLLVQAAVQDGPEQQRLLVFTVRRDREHGLEPAPILFGAAPRAVPISKEVEGAAVEAALDASLSEILPWLRPA